MNAAASLSAAVFTGVDAPSDPVVFVDGLPAPSIRVASLVTEGPLGRRRATLVAPTRRELPTGGRVTIAQAIPFGDGAIRWPVWIDGRIESSRRVTNDGVARFEAGVIDHASAELDARLPWAWRLEGERAIRISAGGATLRAGPRGNRSPGRVPVGGETLHVIADHGEAWSVREAIETLLAFARTVNAAMRHVDLTGIPVAIADATIVGSIPLDRPVSAALASVLDEYGLMLVRESWREGREVVGITAIVPAGRTRVHMFSTDAGRSPVLASTRLGAASADHLGSSGGARRLTARARGWRVESTFDLVAAWSPASQGLDNAAYALGAPGFAGVSDVFRLWALNEDGAFTPPPCSRGPAFDLRAFFGGGAEPARTRLLPCVAVDASGRPLEPIVEASADGGATWFAWTGPATIREDRAAVWLGDAVLADAWCAAVRAGEARVRVTASLRSATPVERTRYRGNAFHGAAEAMTFDLGEAFEFSRVSAGSKHFADVREGSLRADERDDARAMERWVSDRASSPRAGEGGEGEAVLIGAWPMLRPGDRIRLGAGIGDEDDGAVIVSVACEWPVSESKRGPTTRIAIAW